MCNINFVKFQIESANNKGLIKLCSKSDRVETCLNFVDQPGAVYKGEVTINLYFYPVDQIIFGVFVGVTS